MRVLCALTFIFCAVRLYAVAAPASPWEVVARMPASNHDLSAAIVDGLLYVAGGSTETWGPARVPHAFDEIWRLDPTHWTWSAVAKFDRPRIYCGTVAFAGKVWVVGGDTLRADGSRKTEATVEIFDPASGALSRGPDLPEALPAPLALVGGERLYVIGSAGRTAPGRVFSIGYRETVWRREPDGPAQMWALAGASLGGKIYVCVPSTGLAEYDPAAGRWTTIPGPTKPRSAQVAAWRGEIWIMGGRDTADQAETRIFNPTARTWRIGPSLPRPLSWGAAGVVADRLIVTGGSTDKVNGFDYSDLTFALRADFSSPPTTGALTPPPAWDNSRLVGTGGNALPTTTERVFHQLKLQRPVVIMSVPTKSAATEPERLLVIESDGPVSTFPNQTEVRHADVMLDLPAHFQKSTQTYGLAFHPRFPEVPHVYVVYNRQLPKPSENVLARFTVTEFSQLRIDPKSERVLLRWPSDGHNGGDVKFGPDGFLYVSTGDGGPPADPRNIGQRVDIVTGGILRLDVDHEAAGKNYSVPPDNPFVGLASVLPEYWAYGLRNPWRMNFSPTGDLWVGDNGDDSWESVHLIRKGANYGWSVFEGSHPFKRTLALAGPNPHATRPIIELSHAEARSVIGGLVYRGNKIPSLTGNYIFGDYVTGALWAFRWDGNAPQNFQRIAETRARPLAFGEERSGEVLMVRLDGEIHRLIPASPARTSTAAMPTLLSDTGLFASTKTLAPAPGVIPYEINAPLWSDGAEAHRLLALPSGAKITYAEKNSWLLPEGSAVVRTLELPSPSGPRRVETQVMHRESGTWNFYTYAWNAEQTEAQLIAPAGEVRAVPGTTGVTWNYASRSECAVCHTAQTDFVLGLVSTQLDRDVDYSVLHGGVVPQIPALTRLGRLEAAPTSRTAGPRLVNPADVGESLDLRARSYLSVNCAHCHRAGGVGGRAEFQLLDSLPLAKTGLIHGRPLVPLLGPTSRLVIPGHPEQSELFHRLSLKEGGRMPLMGSQVPDAGGIDLIRQWILSMGEKPAAATSNQNP
jgi:uncharacterized repeat protein (TIGR03806 family)